MRQGLFCWALALLIAVGAQAYQLKFKDSANTIRWYKTDIIMDGSFTVSATNDTSPMTGTVSFVTREKVTGVNDDGTANIVSEITDGQMVMKVDDQEVTQPLTGYKVTYKRAPSGKVTELKALGQPEGELAQVPALGFGDQWKIISGLGQGFEFPTDNLNAGTKWTNKSSVAMSPDQLVTMVMNNVLNGVKTVEGASYLSIDSDISLKMPVTKTTMQVAGEPLTIEQSTSLTGKSNTLFNAALGEIYTTTLDGVMKMNLTMPMPGAEDNITMDGKVTMKGGTKRIEEPKADAGT